MGTPFLSEIKIAAFNFPPKGWALCNGQLMQINQNQALFSLLGTMYGGDGRVNFALPDLRDRVAMHIGNGHIQGERGGEQAHTLTISEMPAHVHMANVDGATAAGSNSQLPASNEVLGQTIGKPSQGADFPVSLYSNLLNGPLTTLAPATIGNMGGSQAHENRQPYLTLNFIIALQGAFPSRN